MIQLITVQTVPEKEIQFGARLGNTSMHGDPLEKPAFFSHGFQAYGFQLLRNVSRRLLPAWCAGSPSLKRITSENLEVPFNGTQRDGLRNFLSRLTSYGGIAGE